MPPVRAVDPEDVRHRGRRVFARERGERPLEKTSGVRFGEDINVEVPKPSGKRQLSLEPRAGDAVQAAMGDGYREHAGRTRAGRRVAFTDLPVQGFIEVPQPVEGLVVLGRRADPDRMVVPMDLGLGHHARKLPPDFRLEPKRGEIGSRGRRGEKHVRREQDLPEGIG